MAAATTPAMLARMAVPVALGKAALPRSTFRNRA